MVLNLSTKSKDNREQIVEESRIKSTLAQEILKYKSSKVPTIPLNTMGVCFYIKAQLEIKEIACDNISYNHIEIENKPINKNFSTIVIAIFPPNDHVSTLIIDHSKNPIGQIVVSNQYVSTLIIDHSKNPKELYLFDTSGNVHQTSHGARFTVFHDQFGMDGDLIRGIHLLNTLMQPLQNKISCAYWTAIFNTVLNEKNDITEIIQANGTLQPSILKETIEQVLDLNGNFVTDNAKKLMEKLITPTTKQQVAIGII